MKAIFSIISLVFIFSIGNFKAQELKRNVYFNTASSELNFQSKQLLKKLSLDLQSKEILEIKITGHTDDVGSDSYNLDLSEKRVGQTISFLNELNFPIDKLNKAALGENRPILSNKTNLGRKQNRRVEIVIIYKDKARKKDDIKDLFKQIATKPNEFCINPNRDTILVGRDGGAIEIKANSFNLPATCKNKCVLILLRENFKMSSMLNDNLTTLSNGQILESDGMVDVAAFDCAGNPLTLVKGKEMLILVPTEKMLDDIQFFDGQHTGHDSLLNWNLINNPQNDFVFDSVYPPNEKAGNCAGLYGRFREKYDCEECRFFCRIKRLPTALKGTSNANQKQDNKTFRNCQRIKRARRKAIKRGTDSSNNQNLNSSDPMESDGCKKLFEQFAKYGVDNYAALNDTLTKIYLANQFAKYGVKNAQELRDTLEEIRLNEIKKRLEEQLKRLNNGKASIEDLSYYTFSKVNLGMANCDRFSSYNKSKLTAMVFDIEKDDNLDIKVAFEGEKVIIPASEGDKKVQLSNVPKGKKVWVIALKVVNGVFFMSLFQTIIGEGEIKLDFKKVSLEEIQEAFKRFD